MSAAVDILAKAPGQLFPGAPEDVKRLFREMAAKWHPDHCKDPKASEVFAHLKRARDVRLGKSEEKHLVLTRKRAGDKFSLDYIHTQSIDAGKVFVSASTVSYLVREDMRDLCEPAINLRWEFASPKIKDEMTKYLPNRVKWEDTEQGIFLAYRRAPDQVLLADLLKWEESHGRHLDYKHVMWLISSLLNTCCYLEVSRTAHCGLTPEYLLVSPAMHSVALTGPPLYATPWGTRPKAVPRTVLEAFPRLRAPTYKIEDSRVDLTMVRQLAMRALGHTNAVLLRRDSNLPQGMRDWLCSPAPASAVKDYVGWEKARGKRAFTPYPADARDIYVQLGM